VCIIGALDWATGVEISFSIFYLLPIGLAVWMGSGTAGVVASVFAALVWLTLDILGNKAGYSHPYIPYWNALVRLGFFLVTTVLLIRLRQMTDGLESMVRVRTESLAAEVEQRKRAENETARVCQLEQERLASELHDQLGGYLSGLAFQTKGLAHRLEPACPSEAADAARIVRLINGAADQLRHLASLLVPVSGENDLPSALARLGVELESVFGVTCRIECAGVSPSLDAESCHQLCRIVQEAARNAIRHGKAQRVEISTSRKQGAFEIVVASDGKTGPPPEDTPAGLGLRIMRYRARLLGATLAFGFENNRSVIVCRLPLPVGAATRDSGLSSTGICDA
jgi:signal transduction histidine kinase